jgi:signal recognition particle receptor subunit beta
MGSVPSDGAADSPRAQFKILIAGGFGAGKTTLVSAISEVRPLRTEEPLTSASIGFDDLRGLDGKTSTTVAMDFGRITFANRLVLYLFGTPGQERFWFMWDELAYGALGAVVLADTRRLNDCFPSVDYFEWRSTALTTRPGMRPRRCGSRWTSIRACRPCSATHGRRARRKRS